MDQILFVNSASVDVLEISSSLTSVANSFIDFSQSTQVSGSFVGSLTGTASFASEAQNAQTAVSASYALVTDTALTATSASHALVADSAGSAETATSASFATHATTSDTATSASHALVADSALSAETATSASFASHATDADTATTATSASFATHSATASYLAGLPIKSGRINGASFTGNPRTYTVTFSKPFPSLYSVSVIGQNLRTWDIDNTTTASFTINSNSKNVLTGLVFWQAIAAGEFNS